MNDKIQTTWHDPAVFAENPNDIIHEQNFNTLLKLKTYVSLTECENLFFDNCWLTIKILDKKTKELIIGTDIWGTDGVKKAINFIKEYRS